MKRDFTVLRLSEYPNEKVIFRARLKIEEKKVCLLVE